MRQLAARTRETMGLPGLSVAVYCGDRLVLSEGFGFADLEAGTPATGQTVFRIASISKSLTSIALGILMERGKLDVDAPISKYIDASFLDATMAPNGVTARQLAGHLAGIRNYKGAEFKSALPYADVESSLAVFRRDALELAPLTKFLYTTHGWTLLSRVMEAAAGVPFVKLVQDEVIRPLGMRSTSAENQRTITPNRARYYERNRDSLALVNCPSVDLSAKLAGGEFE